MIIEAAQEYWKLIRNARVHRQAHPTVVSFNVRHLSTMAARPDVHQAVRKRIPSAIYQLNLLGEKEPC
jgi:hypothetical protein